MPFPKITLHCEMDVVDPESGEVHEWAGKTLNDTEALEFWHIAVEHPEPFHLDPKPGNSFEITVRPWPWA